MRMRLVGLALAASSALVMACGGSTPPAEEAAPAAAPAADASHEGHTGGRVFFVSPKEGATVKSPVQLEFGSEMFTIAAVPAGEVTAVRAGTGHFHLGVDTDCLPVGRGDPQGQPVDSLRRRQERHRDAADAGARTSWPCRRATTSTPR